MGMVAIIRRRYGKGGKFGLTFGERSSHNREAMERKARLIHGGLALAGKSLLT